MTVTCLHSGNFNLDSLTEAQTLLIYTDGSVTPDNRGGVGVRVISIDANGEEIINDYQSTGYQNVNSGQMEIIACIYALEEVMRHRLDHGKKQITIFTDSKHVTDSYKNAMFHWVGNRWFWKDGRPVLDAGEWKRLVKLLRDYLNSGVFVEIKWVKGHDTNPHNNAVHKMSKDILRLPAESYAKNSILSVFRPEQIRVPNRLELGSVKMEGQKISIKILAVEYLPLQKLWSHKYTVISKNSSYRGSVDKIFSTFSLDVGKSYFVQFNCDTRNPRIVKVYWEVWVS